MANATKTADRRGAQHGHEEPDLVRFYLDEVGSTPLLTAQEEVDLAKRIEAGVYAAELLRQADAGERDLDIDRRDLEAVARDGADAKSHMIRANLRLVVTVARKSRNAALPLLDAIQEGNLGLIRAVEKFDYVKGFKFSTYAMWWIRQAIQRGNAFQAHTIRLPMHTTEQIAKLDRVERTLLARGDHEPTVQELADESGLPVERVTELRTISRATMSLDVPLDEDGELRMGDLVAGGEGAETVLAYERGALAEDVKASLATLPPTEAMIVSLRYGLHDGHQHTQQEIAQRLGLPRKRVRRLEETALAQLRESSRRDSLLAWAS
ncbi:RNA polymerase primary sigma factor/RNA polymerase nonessential primary-like sigma factor [Prauserella shujinwangii]|uniref:RNA polymerase primary sigma factor/RNA polymerase nonessential primary-like sigma factor n=1 Tax=Prauserella shujinwangii TaxID=1453103 RepID=A0A2T0M2Q0_9PSEU|nr:sigma-70 family RNA polymerase sigma factor [Prauserella shujinwangii]PRX51018.1 RNA polymerase primary sigma factor/RNA polymerase nonessential primary-like sigma factor [Prauserella shujinwangii]